MGPDAGLRYGSEALGASRMGHELDLDDMQRALEAALDGAGPTPAGAFEAMARWYEQYRVAGCALESDGDMLLFQWGTYDWGEGERFELNLTRQVTTAAPHPDDQRMHQLHLTYRFAPTRALVELGANNRWCPHPRELQAFLAFMRADPGFVAVGERSDGEVEIGIWRV